MSQLDFTISLIDKVSKPIQLAQQAISGFAYQSQQAFKKIAIGAAGLAGSFLSIKGILDPALMMGDAITDGVLQGIDNNVMEAISKDSLKFAARFGKSSIEFVNSTTAISKAIGNLSQHDLPQLTQITNTTAAALKSTPEQATLYMGQMFSQFERDANQMGNVAFAEQLAGKAVYMSKAFGTSMAQISQLMRGTKDAATQFGIGIDEQLAILGQLHRTLGTKSAGAYESFIKNAVTGAKKLGLSFVDASGQMLSMPAMLEKIQAKYGTSIEGNLKAQQEIDTAFGSSAVVIKQLYGNVDVLRKNIGFLGASDGMKRATEQAALLANPWERLQAIWQSIRIAIGMTLLPVISPLLDKLTEGGQTLVRWAQLFPNIARWVGYVSLGFLGFAATGAIANIVMGVSKFIMVGWIGISKIFTGMLWLGRKAFIAYTATMKLFRNALFVLRLQAMITGVSLSFLTWPILLGVAAVGLLAYGIYKLVKHWDEIKATIRDSEAFKIACQWFDYLGDSATKIWQTISASWDNAILGIKNSFINAYNWIAKLLNKIPGVNLEIKEIRTLENRLPSSHSNGLAYGISNQSTPLVNSITSINSQIKPKVNGLLQANQLKGIDKGGISRQISGSNTKAPSIDNSKRVDNVTINVANMPSPAELKEWELLENG